MHSTSLGVQELDGAGRDSVAGSTTISAISGSWPGWQWEIASSSRATRPDGPGGRRRDLDSPPFRVRRGRSGPTIPASASPSRASAGRCRAPRSLPAPPVDLERGSRESGRHQRDGRIGDCHASIRDHPELEIAAPFLNRKEREEREEAHRVDREQIDLCVFAAFAVSTRRMDPLSASIADLIQKRPADAGLETSNWLGCRDSNPDPTVQSRMSYHWTTPQQGPNRAAIISTETSTVNNDVSDLVSFEF